MMLRGSLSFSYRSIVFHALRQLPLLSLLCFLFQRPNRMTTLGQSNGGGPLEPYVYVIYYLDDQCSHSPVSLAGFVSDDDETVHAADFVPETANGTTTNLAFPYSGPPAPACSMESSCLLNPFSTECRALNQTRIGVTTFSISDQGLVYQCDNTNTNGDCGFLVGCYLSSVYPHCYFRVALTSTLVTNASLLANTHNVSHDVYHEQAYMVFYNDSQCQILEGIQGALAGTTDYVMTDPTISCQDAMVCLFNPLGQACSTLLGVGYNRTNYTVTFDVVNQGRDVALCPQPAPSSHPSSSSIAVHPYHNISNQSSSLGCTDIVTTPSQPCLPSPIHPSCYYKWTSAVELLQHPESFLGSASPDSYYFNSSFGQHHPSDTAATSSAGVFTFGQAWTRWWWIVIAVVAGMSL